MLISLLIASALSVSAVSGRVLTECPKAVSPTLFPAEATWPAGNDAAPAFSPDNRTVFFTHASGDARTIMVSHRTANGWSSPEPATFSGKWRDIEPVMSPDGRYLLFISNRPVQQIGQPLDGFFGGEVQPRAGGNIWRVDRTSQGWSEPVRLSAVINSSGAIYSPAVTSDGSVYFNRPDPVTHKSHIYRAQASKGGFLPPEPLPISDGTISDYDAAAAPDDSFIIFSSGRPPAPNGSSILFVTFRQRHGWTAPSPLPCQIEGLEARLSPDLTTLYFTADPNKTGASRIFEVSTSELVNSERIPKPLQRISLNGIIHDDTDDTLAFTPNGDTVFFDRSEGSHKTIFISHKIAGRWSVPEVANFSGRWFDQDPIVAPDGTYLLFNSDRPVSPDGQPLTQSFFSKTVAPGANIWRVDRKGRGWGEPRWLKPVINSGVFIDFASISLNNTLYFMRWDAPRRVMQLWRAQFMKGQYVMPERVVLGDPAVSIHDPAVSADQSFIVFDYGKATGGLGRLCIAFRRGDGWSEPVDLGDVINNEIPWGAHLAPNSRTVYVTGQSGIKSLDLTPWLSAEKFSGRK